MKETILGLNRDIKYYFCQETINMGKGIDGLCGVIRNSLLRDPFSSEVFVFLSRNRKQMKILRWNDGAFILYTVKLYTGRCFKPLYDAFSGSYSMDWDDFLGLVSDYGTHRKYQKRL